MFDTATSRFRQFARSAWAADWNFLATDMSARMFFLDFVVFPPLALILTQCAEAPERGTTLPETSA